MRCLMRTRTGHAAALRDAAEAGVEAQLGAGRGRAAGGGGGGAVKSGA